MSPIFVRPLLGLVVLFFSSSSTAFINTAKHKILAPEIRNYMNLRRERRVVGYDEICLFATRENELDNFADSVILRDGSKKSLLQSAFSALSDNDKYDAVMTGLCAKILDGEIAEPNQGEEASFQSPAYAKLADPIRLLEEMNNRRVKASGRSLMALIDASATTQDAPVMATVLSLAIRNGRLSQYGTLQADLCTFPPNPESKFRNNHEDGKIETRSSRLESLIDVPTDDRESEIFGALVTIFVVGFCLLINGFGNAVGLDAITPITGFLLGFITTLGVVDNGFDAIKFVTSTAIKSNDKVPDSVKNISIEKENLPFNLGSGKITGTVVRGLSRLFVTDTERECECEAAALFIAYSLGLPCFAFRPNALEAAILMFESNKSDDNTKEWNNLDTLWSDAGIMKMLVWLISPVAIEYSKHPQLIASDPREASGFLERLREKAPVMGISIDQLESMLPSEETDDLLKWAYAEADSLLRENRKVVEELTNLLAGGAATVGDCVAVLEQW